MFVIPANAHCADLAGTLNIPSSQRKLGSSDLQSVKDAGFLLSLE